MDTPDTTHLASAGVDTDSVAMVCTDAVLSILLMAIPHTPVPMPIGTGIKRSLIYGKPQILSSEKNQK